MTLMPPPVHSSNMLPRNAREQLAQATKSLAEQDAAGRKALADACGTEFSADNLFAAAAIIRKLRAERDAIQSSAMQNAEIMAKAVAGVGHDANSIMSGKPIHAESPLAPIQAQLNTLRDSLAKAIANHEAFAANVRATLIDRALTEIPDIAGYFTSDTPLQRAGEAAAVFITNNDRVIREAYLRRRGWRLALNNAWIGPDGGNSTPFDAAVIRQVKADVAPFAVFAQRQASGPTLFWPDAKFGKYPKMEPAMVHPDVQAARHKAAHVAHFQPEEQDGKGALEVLPMIADLAQADAETSQINLTNPVAPPVVAPIKWNGNTEETFEMPRLG